MAEKRIQMKKDMINKFIEKEILKNPSSEFIRDVEIKI